MVNFYIPDFWSKYNLNIFLINDMENNPQCYYPDIKVSAIYGTFPNAKWNAGRVLLDMPPNNIKETINTINSYGVPIRYTFTNSLLKEHHLKDEYCNYLMECADNGMNEVLVNSPLLEDYLRNTFPNFKYISSTTKCITDITELEREADKYYLTVVDYRFNNNYEVLSKLEKKDKYEFLLNDNCDPCCKKRKEHYDYLAKMQLEQHFSTDNFNCPLQHNDFYGSQKYSTFISNTDLYDKYIEEMCFSHFKIQGRHEHKLDVLESYMYYMVKPEYRDETRLRFLKYLYAN